MTNNPLLQTTCPKCGCTGQLYLTFETMDKSWECTCYKCGKIFSIPEKQIPLELRNQKYQYSEHILKSCKMEEK